MIEAGSTPSDPRSPDSAMSSSGFKRLLVTASLLLRFYPTFAVAALYGQWLLSWIVLGRQPIPMIDDPKFIPYTNHLMPVTYFAFLGLLPAGIVSLNLEAVRAGRQKSWRPFVVGVALLVTQWVALIVLMRVDPWRVGYWWMD